MNYLVPSGGRPSRSPKSTTENSIHVDNMYKSSIVSSDGRDSFSGYVPEDFNFDLANDWEPLGGLGEAVPALQGISDSLDSFSKRITGGVPKFKYLSPQTWSGPSYLSLTLPFELNSWTSSAQDVHTPMVAMMRLITPETDKAGRLVTPGPSPILQAINAYRDNAEELKEQSSEGLINGKIFTCSIGNFFRMSPCVITNVSAAIDGQFEHESGLPISAVMNVQVQSYWPVSREDIESWFFADKYGVI